MKNREKQWLVYLLVNPFNRKPFYVGITVDASRREMEHGKDFMNPYRVHIIDAISQAGSSFQMVEIDYRPNIESALAAELKWIDSFLRRGFLLVNREASDEVRLEAWQLHVTACGFSELNLTFYAPGSCEHASWGSGETAILSKRLLDGYDLAAMSLAHKRSQYGVLLKLRGVAVTNPYVEDKMRSLGWLDTYGGLVHPAIFHFTK